MYIGLDFETTGLDPLKHVPLTLGLAWETKDGIASHEFEFNLQSAGKWDIEAMYVNKSIPFWKPDAPWSTDMFDWTICVYLMDQGWSPFDKSLVPVGWNVGGFDMRFMQTFFPQASKFFSHRYMELNSLAYACDLAAPPAGNESIKQEAKNYAVEQADINGQDVNWHNAEWDAIASLYSFQYMTRRLDI